MVRRLTVFTAWAFFLGSIVLWPITQLTVAKHEPPFTLGLSWLAIILTAADFLKTSMVHEEQGEEE